MKHFFVNAQRREWLSYCIGVARDAVLFARGLPDVRSMPEAISVGARNLGLPERHVAYFYHAKPLSVRRHTYDEWRRAEVRECEKREQLMTEKLAAARQRRQRMEYAQCGDSGQESATHSSMRPCR